MTAASILVTASVIGRFSHPIVPTLVALVITRVPFKFWPRALKQDFDVLSVMDGDVCHELVDL